MTYIPEDKKKLIIDRATLENALTSMLPDPKTSGSQLLYDCPKCNGKHKLKYGKGRKIVKCFSCDIGTSKPVKFLQEYFGMSFPEALEELARIENIPLDGIPVKSPSNIEKGKAKINKRKEAKATAAQPYCVTKLKESGLEEKDIIASVYVDGQTRKEVPTFRAGGIDAKWQVVPGDDIIITYYDLDGREMHYYKKDKTGNATGNSLPFKRIRYKLPENHKDRFGNVAKYRSPYGSDSKLYIPQAIRDKYQRGAKIKTLYIQEGELKAEKACKHGLLSVGIMGIHNIASNKKLPVEFDLLIKKCQIEDIVFLLDSDWQDLSSKIDAKHAADQRPRSFHRAVVNFRAHFYAFTSIDIHLKIFFGHVVDNPEKAKGIDDLFVKVLPSREDILLPKCKKALLQPDGNADYLKFYDITTASDHKLYSYWHLSNKEDFVNHHIKRLKEVPEFKYGRIKWRIENGEAVLAQPLLDHEQFWNEENAPKGKLKLSFNYKRCYVFLQNRGFARYNLGNRQWIWIHIEDNIVTEVDSYQIKDYVINFVKQIDREDVENLLYAGAKGYLGPESLGNLEYRDLSFHLPSKGIQYMYFKNCFWKITSGAISSAQIKDLQGHVWQDKLRDFEPTIVEPLLSELLKLTPKDAEELPRLKEYIGEFTIDFSKSGLNCDFLQFIFNTCRFSRKSLDLYSDDETFHTTRHFLSKITGIGYLLHRYRDANILKAVVAMDLKMSEVGSSNGRSGKSLIGNMLEHLVPTVTIPGKKRDLLEDRFLFSEVDERTEAIVMDDVRINFDLEGLFPHITGKFTVERKGEGKQTLPSNLPQKFYITTNHALKGDGGSFKDRQLLLGFSDWYNETHKPVDDFGKLFFDEWDTDQFNLFYNFAAFCLHTYFKYGIIQAPQHELQKRKVRQDIGESILEWADVYFSNPTNLNVQIIKSDMYSIKSDEAKSLKRGSGFADSFPSDARWIDIRKFKKRLKKYCEYKGFMFNPSADGKDIKKGGVEYIEIGVSEEYYNTVHNLSESQKGSFLDED